VVPGKGKIIGTLVPVNSLRSKNQNPQDWGTFETGLYFLDWLKKTGQSAWQMLPLNQSQLEKGSKTRHVPSPYKGYGIGLDPKYLSEVSKVSRVPKTSKAFKDFIQLSSSWLEDYAFFCALRDHYGTDDWREWEPGLRNRKKEAIDAWSKRLKRQVDNHILEQFKLHQSFWQLKRKAERLGIFLVGDIPFYISLKSPLAWVNQGLFCIEKDGRMKYVSGIPNSPTTHWGRQVWGHPLYAWEKEEEIIDFWKQRLAYLSNFFDYVRLDHAKAFVQYGRIDTNNSKNDRWVSGPGVSVLRQIIDFGRKHSMHIFAEDAGVDLERLHNILDKLSVPGIRLFRYAYDEKVGKFVKDYVRIHNYSKEAIAYSTIHDTETLMGYLKIISPEIKKNIADLSGVEYSSDDREFGRSIMKSIMDSPARVVIFPIQDWLLTQDRINIPGTEKEVGDRNWSYTLKTPVEDLPLNL
jgi:4-alpha-glucanotransferase